MILQHHGSFNCEKLQKAVSGIMRKLKKNSPEIWATYCRGSVRSMWIVLYFPQAFIESFPFVWLPITVLVLLISKEVFWCEEGSTMEVKDHEVHQFTYSNCKSAQIQSVKEPLENLFYL